MAGDDLSRDDLLQLSPDDALRGGLGERSAGAPPLDTVCALALAYQSRAEGAPEDVLGLAVTALGMVRDRAGAGPLSPAVRDDLRRRLAFPAEGYPVTGAWLAALADAAGSGAELERGQAFLFRAVELRRFVAANVRDTARAT
ncbi:MAG TPA: hypothetical protein VHT91_49450 [Kofleriaceae bacterium]|jgi:hypothetical protein|nr:hypothetical protein [Kofleriaceae bacterium]